MLLPEWVWVEIMVWAEIIIILVPADARVGRHAKAGNLDDK